VVEREARAGKILTGLRAGSKKILTGLTGLAGFTGLRAGSGKQGEGDNNTGVRIQPARFRPRFAPAAPVMNPLKL